MGDDAAFDFIKRKRVRDALKTIAGAERVTFIVGAGPSAEIGFPTWTELIRRLLVRAVNKVSLDRMKFEHADEAALQVARDIIQRDGVVAAATMAQAKLGANFLNTVRTELYDGVPDHVAPGMLHTEIARLLATFDAQDREIATTNYDLMQEDALTRVGLNPVPVVGGEPAGADEIFVRHLHGVVTQDELSHVVITEADYARLQESATWQENFLAHSLATTCCVFVGMSMTDPNILRLLHKATQSQKVQHVALFARMVVRDPPEAVAEAQRGREELGTARWQQVGVRPVMTDYVMQLPEFLNEARLMRSGSNVGAYPDRLKAWELAISERWYQFDSRPRFVALQHDLHAALRDALDDFEAHLADTLVDRPDESFSLRLFSRVPSRRQLVALASSEMEWRDPAAIDREKIGLPARHVAVEAFCQGATVIAALDQASEPHWRTVRAVPIIITDDRFGRLPVGVVTVASTASERISILPKLSSAVPVAEQGLVDLGCRVLGLSEGLSGAF